MNKKTIIITSLALVLIIVGMFTLTACRNEADNEKTYVSKVEAYTDENGNPLFDNKEADKFEQKIIHDIVMSHLNAPDNGKKKKVIFLGYDGCRVDVLKYVNKSEKEAYINSESKYSAEEKEKYLKGNSALNYFLSKENTGLYFAYAGGEKGGKTQQATSTCPGWATMLTGKWALEEGGHGVKDNGIGKNDVKTFLTKAAEGVNGTKYSVSFTASWGPHFTETYAGDITYAKNNNLDIDYSLKDDDEGTFNDVMKRIRGEDDETDVIFFTLEGTDHAGHSTKFGIHRPDYVAGFMEEEAYAYEMLKAIESRSTYGEEDWCIIIATDHGGFNYSHGGQTVMERTTFLATNKIQYLPTK